MKKVATIFLVTVLLLEGAGLTRKQQGLSDLCTPRNVPVIVSGESPVEVVRHNFYLYPGALGQRINCELTIRNRASRIVERVTILVDYLDGSDNYIFSIRFGGTISERETELENYPSFIVNLWDRAKGKGELLFLVGTNLLSTTALPEKARISQLFLTYSDGESEDISYGPWRSEPILEETPDFFKVERQPTAVPEEIWGTITIDTKGRVLDFRMRPESKSSEPITETLRKELSKWHFVPALRDGFAEVENLNIRLRFQPRRVYPVRECLLDDPRSPRIFVAVDFLPDAETKGHWIPYYAGYPARGRFQSQRAFSR